MNKKAVLSYIFILSLYSICSFSQESYIKIFPDEVVQFCPGQIEVPVRIVGFNNIISMQGSLGWDPNLLSWNGISDFGPVSLGLNAGNFGTQFSSIGKLSFLWTDAALKGLTLADSVVLFKVSFKVIQRASTSIQVTNDPAVLEFIDVSLKEVPSEGQSGAVIFTQLSNIVTVKDGDWHDPKSWEGGSIPCPESNVEIRHLIKIYENASCRKLTILPGAHTELKPGKILSVLERL